MIDVIKMLLGGVTAHPAVTRHVLDIKRRVYTRILTLTAEAYPTDEPIDRATTEGMTPIAMHRGRQWTKRPFGCCWFHLTGTVPAEGEGKPLVALVKIQGEAVSYEGEATGDIITSILSVPDVLQPPTLGKCVVAVTDRGVAGAPVDLWLDAGFNGINGNFICRAVFRYADLAVLHEDVRDYYYEYLTLAVLLSTDRHNPHLTPALKQSLLDVLTCSYALFRKGDVPAARAALAPYYGLSAEEEGVWYTLVGHAHLDLAWMWPERESRRKAVRTITNAVRQAERQPDYVFGLSQAQMLDWVRQSTPTLFAELQQAVARGQVELQGGMWVECDSNMPDGESLIRQFLYGDDFFLQYFGHTSDVVWLPDAFGFTRTLPQIIAGVGKHYFATTKLTWNRVNRFPYQTFWWQAPDGSRILSHISPEGTYCNDGSPLAVAKAEERNVQPETGEALIIYGVGDGGGGPGEAHVQLALHSKGLAGMARTRMASAEDFFGRLAAHAQDAPTVDDELYLEYHRGTYTSQREQKRCNREAERIMHLLEWMLAYYGRDALVTHSMWRTLLLQQFHDILPGSGIGRVHRESVEALTNLIENARRAALDLLPPAEGFGYLNPAPFSRIEYQMYQGEAYLVRADAYSSAVVTPLAHGSEAGDDYLENEWVRVQFAQGVIVSYLDKRRGYDYARGGLNTLRLYYDKDKKYDAWNIGLDYQRHPRRLRFLSAHAHTEGGTAVMVLTWALPHGSVTQHVRLGYGTQVVFDTTVDWHESHLMLRADFAPAIDSDTAVCDVPFGTVCRSTRNDDSVQRAMLEVCAHKYVSVGDGHGNFALYTDSHYGWRLKEGVLSLDMLRSPKHPDPDCDMGTHRFAYAMDIPATPMDATIGGYCFNYPLVPLSVAAEVRPLAWVDHPHVVVETIKPAHRGEGYVVRLYERMGLHAECELHTARAGSLWATDLEERHPAPITPRLTFRPHEIKTVWVRPSAE